MARLFQLFVFALAAAVASGVARAEDSAEFVMLVDLSSRMAARQTATAQTIRDLAGTGIHGRMQEGQTLTIWYYDTAFSTNMAPLVWDSRRASDFAMRAEGSFRAKKFLREARPKGPTLGPVVGKTAWFTAMVLTDGYLPFAGTPFDDEINSTMLKARDRFAREKKPFLVTLVARNGEWAAYSVHTNLGGTIDLPVVPTNSPALDAALASLRAAITNDSTENEPKRGVEEVREAKAPEQKQPEPVTVKAKVEEERQTSPQRGSATLAAVEPVVAPPPKIEARAEPVAQKLAEPLARPPEKIVEEAKPALVESKPNVVAVKTAMEIPPPEPAPRIEAETSKPTTASAPRSVAVVSTQTPEQGQTSPQRGSATLAVEAAPVSREFPWPVLLAALGVIAAVGALAYMRFAQPGGSARGSLISQSLDAERDSTRPPRR